MVVAIGIYLPAALMDHASSMPTENNSRRRRYFFSLIVSVVLLGCEFSQGQRAETTNSTPDAPRPSVTKKNFFRA
jgi:hypothetical protein